MKKLLLIGIVALCIPFVHGKEEKYMKPIRKYIQKTKTWLADSHNKKKVILGGASVVAIGIGVAVSMYLVNANIELILAKINQPFASGILFFKKQDDAHYQVLLGKNDDNTWQDFGGMREWGESPRATALREATEESCLLCDDIAVLPKGFKIHATKTYQTFADAIKSNQAFHIDYRNKRGIYRLYLVPAPPCMNTAQFLEHRRHIKNNPRDFDIHLTETNDISWINAQQLYDVVKDTKDDQLATVIIDGKNYLIRKSCYGSFTTGLAKLLGQ